MSPTRRDTLKAAGAASGLAMLGGHAVAQQDSPDGDGDGPGAQTLESGQGAVRVGHFVSGAPAVNVRVVPAEGTDTSGSDDDEIGGSGTDDTTTGNETETGNETGGNTTGNTSDDNTSEDLQADNESNETGGNETAGNETDGGVGTPDDTSDAEGQMIAENVSFGDVSEYATVEAGDYTVQLLAAEGGTGDTDTAGNATDDGMGGNETGGNTTGNASDDNTSEDLQVGNESNETAGNETAGNETAGNETADGNESEDDMFSGGILDDDDENETATDNETGGMVGNETGNETGGVAGNETDDGVGTTDDSGGEVIYEEDVTVGETYYTVAAVGTGADDIDLHVLRDYDAAQVRLVHASPDAPAVDVVAPDASMTLFDDVSFATATEYVGVPPGSYSLSVREAADMNDGDEVGTFDVEVESGEAYSAYAVGSPSGGEEEFDLVVQQDGQGADAGLGQEGAPGQQGEPGASGNETGGPGGDGPPGQDNDSDAPGQSGDAGNNSADDEPGSAGGAAGPNEPGNASGGNASGNESGNESDDEDDDGILAF